MFIFYVNFKRERKKEARIIFSTLQKRNYVEKKKIDLRI